MDDSFELPNLVTDSESDHHGSSDQSMSEFSSESDGEEGEFTTSHHLQNPSFLSSNAMMSEEVQNTGENVFQQLPQHLETGQHCIIFLLDLYILYIYIVYKKQM